MQLHTAPLKRLATGIYDGPHATPKESDEGPIFLGIKNVTAEGRLDLSEIRHVAEEDFAKWTRRVVPQKDDLVFSYEATLHLYARIPEGFRGCLGRRMALIRPDPEKIEPRFFHYYLLSPIWREKMEAITIVGATVNRIPLTLVPDVEVSVPDLATQATIADILSAYDDLIENNRRRIALLEQAARELYREWFVRLRFPGHEHVKIIDGVPEGWTRKSLGEIADLTWGDTSKTKSEYVSEGFDAFSASGLDGKLTTYDFDRIGIVVSAIGAQCGKTWLARGKWSCIKNTIRFWPLDNNISTEFLYLATDLETFWPRRGAAQPFISQGDARRQTVLLPPSDIMQAFSHFPQDAFEQVHSLTQQNIKLSQARDLLLPRLMNGSIPV